MMKDIRYFNDYAGEDGYIIVDSIEGEIPGGKKKLSELGVNAYEVVSATGDDNHPDVDPRDASTKILYIVETGTEDTTYIPWIWTLDESAEYQWKQLGSKPLPDNSWKQWSDDKGSSSTSDESVYIGQSNRIERDDTYVLGKGNIVTSTDNSQDYSDTDVVSIGKNNTTQDGANVYQLGRDNTVIGNNLGNKNYYPNSMAVNIGRDNTINTPDRLDRGGEGINIGKLNTAQGFGINIGQNNTAKNVSIAIGENRHADGTNALSIGFDKKSYDIDLYDVNSLKYGNDYYPIGEYTPIKLSDIGRLVKYAAFDSTTHLPVEVKRYSMVYNEETGKVTFYESTDTGTIYGYLTGTPVVTSLDRAVGYLDGDNIISSKSAPSGQTIRTYYRYYWYDYGNEPSESTKNSRAIIGTTKTTIYIDPVKFVPNNWVAYNYSDYAQYLISGDDVKSNVYITNERMFVGNPGRDTLCSIRITGKEVDGKFIPWFNDNFPKSECTTRDFDPRSIFTKSYFADELKEKYNFYLSSETCHKNLNEVQAGAKAIGSLINVNYGGFGIAGEYSQSLWVSLTDKFVADDRTGTEYYYDNGNVKTNNYAVTCVTDTKVLTPAGLLDKFCTTINSGAFGINAGRSTGSKPGALFANSGAIAIGNNLTVDNGGIGIGVDNGEIGCGSVAIGVNNFSPNCAGTLMIANNTTYRSGYNDSKNEIYNHGSSIFGTGNYLQNSHAGATVLGNYNAVGDTNPAYGAVAMGNYNCIKGSGAVSIGRGATAKYGALSISCGIGDTYPGCGGTFATDGSIALGYKGIYSQAGSLSMGYNGVFSIYGSFAIGYNGVSAFDSSFAIGHEGSYARDRSVSIGIGGVCAHNQSYAFGRAITSISNSMSIGFAGVNSYSGALAIGSSGVVSVYDSVAIGLQGVKGSNGSFAAGRGGTTAFNTSTAYGTGAFATNYSTALSINSYLTYSGSGVFKNSDFFYFTGRNYDCTGYVDVKLGGITRVYGYKTETVRGVITYVEDSSGSLYLYKTPTGKYYENLNDIPYEDYNVAIRGHIDENGWLIPFLGAKADVMGDIEIPDTWVNVTWGSETNQVQVRKSAVPTDFLTCGATNNSMILGDSSYAGYGSLAIAQSAGWDSRQFYYNKSNWSSGGEYGKIITTHAGNEFTKDGKQYLRTFRAFESMATNLSIAIGTSSRANNASLSFGYFVDADNGSMALGYGGKDKPNMYGQAKNNSLLISGLGNPTDDKNPRGSSSNKSIAIGTANIADNQSISIGDENIADRNAFAFGTKNTAYGWSIALGVNNTSYDGLGGHATMIGQFNTSTSNQETIHKVFQIYVDGDGNITQEQINELSGRESAYRRLLDPYLDSDMKAYLNTADAGNNDYYLGRADEMAWGYYSYFTWLQQLGNQPPFIFSSADRAALEANMQQQPQTLEEYKSLMLQVCSIVQNYTNVDDLRSSINDATTMDDLYAIWATQLWQNIVRSLQWSGDPIPGVVSDYNVLQQILDAYRNWNNYGLSLRSSIAPHYETIEDDVVCNSFLAGNNNTSNHYNSILIGALNESQAPQVQPDPTYHTTDDDGFMIAAGYRNVVGRNYDIAIGHRSKAIGGENVALQHSEAKGYRNFAAFDSSIEGTGNISVMESNANITLSESAKAVTSSVLHNTLLNTKVNVAGNNWYSSSTGTYVVLKNIMTNCKLDGNIYDDPQSKACGLYAYSVGYNIMSNLYRGRIDSYSIWDNVLIGNDTKNPASYDYEYARYDVNNTQSFSRNFIFRPRNGSQNYSTGETFNGGIRITDTLAFDENVVLLSSVDIPKPTGEDESYKYRYVSNNFLMHSRLIGNPKAVVDNVLFGDSILSADYVRTDTGTTAISNNFLLNSHLRATAYGHRDSNKRGVLNTNFLIGTDAVDVEATFSFNDRTGKVDDPGYFVLQRTYRCANFGDNDVSFANDTFVQGSENSIAGLTHSSIFGNQNTVSGTADYIQYIDEQDYLGNGINALHVMGDKNYVFYKRPDTVAYWDYLARTCILGANNTVIGDALGANTIIGDNNDIDDYYPLLTENELIAKQTQLATTSYCSLSEDAVAYTLTNGQKTTITTNRQISTSIFVSGDRLARDEYSRFATSIEWREFATRYNNGTLAKGYYKITGTIDVTLLTATLYEGTYRPYHTVITMENGVVIRQSDYAQNRSAAHCTTKNILIGSYNRVRSQIHAYALIGSDNEVINSLAVTDRYDWKHGIGNGFLQGNNNYAEDGSNIILMGNGNSGHGHNAVAIGCQLKANQWQTVIGKYNLEIEGPNRLTSENPNDPTKALFIIGNGHSTTDDTDWQDETKITRSNALEVYADGHMKVSGNVEAANIPAPPSSDGQYALNCTVSNGVVTYAWVPVGTTMTT